MENEMKIKRFEKILVSLHNSIYIIMNQTFNIFKSLKSLFIYLREKK